MTPSQIVKRYFCIIFILLLAACGPGPAGTTTTPTEVDVTAIYAQVKSTAIAQMTQTAAAQPTITITPTALPTETITPTPTRTFAPTLTAAPTLTPPPSFTLKGLRVAYIIKGNLYVQDSGGQPVQLTHSGTDHTPVFSENGQEIVFYRGASSAKNDVYLINSDGSEERTLVTSSQLTALGLGYDELTVFHELAFVPGTRHILFSTKEFGPIGDGRPFGGTLNQDLLIVDTDSGKLKQVLPPGKASYFQPAPNGKLVWVLSEGHLDVIGIDGALVRRLKDLPPLLPDIFFAMPTIYWTADSQKLNLMIPSESISAWPELQTIWQFSLDSGSTAEIHLSLPPLIPAFSISPDGNWIVYNSCCYSKTSAPVSDGMYVENLRTGIAKPIEIAQTGGVADSYYWNPDNMHFSIQRTFAEDYLGDIHGNVAPLISQGDFLAWIDQNRYISSGVVLGEIGKKGKVLVVDLPSGVSYSDPEHFTFVFMKPK